MAEVVVAGSYNQDFVFEVEVLPAAGRTQPGELRIGHGGKGFNQAIACHRLQADTIFIGGVGEDSLADGLVEFSGREGLRVELERIAGAPTGAASIAVDRHGSNAIVVALGANLCLGVEEIDRRRDLIESARILLVQGEMNPAATIRALEIAAEGGLISIFNPAPVPQIYLTRACELASIITPNEHEFIDLYRHFGGPIKMQTLTEPSVESLTQMCADVPVPKIIITLGERGVFVHQKLSSAASGSPINYFIPALMIERVIDTTGAGDAFNGGLAVGILRYPDDFERAVSFAICVAGLSVTRHGAAVAMPSLQETLSKFSNLRFPRSLDRDSTEAANERE